MIYKTEQTGEFQARAIRLFRFTFPFTMSQVCVTAGALHSSEAMMVARPGAEVRVGVRTAAVRAAQPGAAARFLAAATTAARPDAAVHSPVELKEAAMMAARPDAAVRSLAQSGVMVAVLVAQVKYGQYYVAVLNRSTDRDADDHAHHSGACAVVLSGWRAAAQDHCASALIRLVMADHLTCLPHVTDCLALLSEFSSPAD